MSLSEKEAIFERGAPADTGRTADRAAEKMDQAEVRTFAESRGKLKGRDGGKNNLRQSENFDEEVSDPL